MRSLGFFDDLATSIREALADEVYKVDKLWKSERTKFQVQFAMATLLKEDLRPVNGASFFDPFTSDVDTSIMKSMGFKNIDRNEEESADEGCGFSCHIVCGCTATCFGPIGAK